MVTLFDPMLTITTLFLLELNFSCLLAIHTCSFYFHYFTVKPELTSDHIHFWGGGVNQVYFLWPLSSAGSKCSVVFVLTLIMLNVFVILFQYHSLPWLFQGMSLWLQLSFMFDTKLFHPQWVNAAKHPLFYSPFKVTQVVIYVIVTIF